MHNGVKIEPKKKIHLVCLEKSVSLAARLALQPPCIQGATKQLLRLRHNLTILGRQKRAPDATEV